MAVWLVLLIEGIHIRPNHTNDAKGRNLQSLRSAAPALLPPSIDPASFDDDFTSSDFTQVTKRLQNRLTQQDSITAQVLAAKRTTGFNYSTIQLQQYSITAEFNYNTIQFLSITTNQTGLRGKCFWIVASLICKDTSEDKRLAKIMM
ncbi:hypothetical protein LXL04_018726 [Taraxacum kok-saghyz]